MVRLSDENGRQLYRQIWMMTHHFRQNCGVEDKDLATKDWYNNCAFTGDAMSAIPRPISARRNPEELQSGDCMTQEEFHRIYERMPEDFKAELIGGTVYVASPLKIAHSESHPLVSAVLTLYQGSTPGVKTGDNGTLILGNESEPQPDLYLRIEAQFGGQAKVSQDYVVGAPELVVEIANSSRSIDLHAKQQDYARSGVKEYLVVCVNEREVRCFNLSEREEVQIGTDTICRLRTFPGLWLDVRALFAEDVTQLVATLQRGLATPEHADFVARLAAKR
jgi:Uma2 family endonuclease